MNTFYRGDDGRIHSLGENNEIRHWKYIKKIPVGKGFRYFYSWDEYRAYLADPAAELQNTGQKAANQLQSAGRRAAQEARSAGRSAQRKIDKGRRSVERVTKAADRSRMTVSGAKQANASKPESTRKRLNDLAKKVSQKWNDDKELIKEKIEKAKKWIKDIFSKSEEKDKDKEKKKEKKKDPYEKYKYVKKIEINGKTRYFYSNEELDAYNKRKEYQKNEPDYLKNLKHSDEPYTRQEDALLVNPKFDRRDNTKAYEYNCAECTAIYELRRRGYDVESNGVSGKTDDESFLGRMKQFRNTTLYNTDLRFSVYYEGADIQRVPRTSSDEETYKAIYKEIDKNPPGSRGDLSVQWKDGGAHSMVWEKDSNGKIRIIDSQVSGSKVYTEYDLRGLSKQIDNSSKLSAGRAGVVRTDNLKLKKGITKICKNSTSKPKIESEHDAPYKIVLDEDGSYTYRKNTEKSFVTEYPVLMEDYNRKHAK